MSPAPAKRADTPPAAVPTEPAPVELSAEAKRKLREQARREAEAKFKAAEVERLTAAKAGAAPPPKVAPGAAEPVDPSRTDAMRAADAAVFLRGVLWPVLSVLSLFTPWELAELTEAMAKEDGAAWVPVARRYRWVDLLVTWAGVPARLVARVRSLAKRREKKPPPAEPAKGEPSR